MEFLLLPWFIRRCIIDLVIQNHPEYRLVNREWFKRVLVNSGKVKLDTSPIVIPTLSSSIKRDVERIDFYRLHDLDWRTIYHYKSVKRLYLLAFNEPTAFEIDSFNMYLTEIPPLICLCLYGFNQIKFDVLGTLSRHHQSLKELSINLNSFDMDKLVKFEFKNLTSLSLLNIRKPVDFIKLINVMPRLNKLNLSFDSDFYDSTWLGSEVVRSITDLVLSFYYDDYNQDIKIDLTKFPNIERFELSGYMELADRQFCPLIKDLIIGGTINYIYRMISGTFTKLESLTLFIHSGTITKFYDLLKLCMDLETLTTLKVSTWLVFRTLDLLPSGSSHLTHLSLEGDFSFSSSLLNWLVYLNLKTLDLHACQLGELKTLKDVTFRHLEHIIIRHFDRQMVDEIFGYFNSGTRQHLNFVDLIQCREGCSG